MNRIFKAFSKEPTSLFETTILQQLENDKKKSSMSLGTEIGRQPQQQFSSHVPIIMQKFAIFFETHSKITF
jgi:hypothetical protein